MSETNENLIPPERSPVPQNNAGQPSAAAVGCNRLLAGVKALTEPNYHELNAGRNDRLLHAVLCAYAKHHLDCEDIGWNQLGDILHSAICNEIGDNSYIEWSERITGGQDAE